MTAATAWMGYAAGALNRLLALDPEAERILADVAPCQLGLRIDGLPRPLLVTVLAGHVEIREWPAGCVVDVEVSGAPASLLAMLRDGVEADVVRQGRVRIHGDAGTAERLRDALARLHVDWEEWLAGRVGDVVAHQLGNAVRGLRDWLGTVREHVERDVGEYLTGEVAQLADDWQVREFVDQVDDLRDAVERLEQRVARAESRRRAGP